MRSTTGVYYDFFFFYRKRSGPEDQIQYMISEKKDKKVQRAQVNSLFFKQLRELLGEFSIN